MDKKPSTVNISASDSSSNSIKPESSVLHPKESSRPQADRNSPTGLSDAVAAHGMTRPDHPIAGAKPNQDAAPNADAVADVTPTSHWERNALLTDTQKIHEQSWQAIQPFLEDLQRGTWHMVDSAVAGARQIHERVSYQTAMILENFDIEANARLAASLDRAVAKIAECQHDTEHNLLTFVVDSQKELVQVSSRAIQELQRDATVRADFQKEVQGKLDEVKRSANEVTNEIRQIGETVSKDIAQYIDQTRENFQARQRLVDELANTAEERIEQMTRAATGTVVRQVRGILDREISEFFIQALRTGLSQLEDNSRHNTLDAEQKGTPDGGVQEFPAKAETSISKEIQSQEGGQLYATRQIRFRESFASLYGKERSYAEYEPAYRFGCSLASNPKYASKDWRTIESEVRRDWENQGGNHWEKFKGSIQYAWLSAFSED
jgi:hypothetical protein